MPEATLLYSVTTAVVAGLVIWVAVVLRTAKQPWAREAPPRVVALADDPPLEPAASQDADVPPEAEPKPAAAAFSASDEPNVPADEPPGVAKVAPAEAKDGVQAEADALGADGEAEAKKAGA